MPVSKRKSKSPAFRRRGQSLLSARGGLRQLFKKLKFNNKPPVSNKVRRSPRSSKRILMFGWELPPFNSGGLGVASYELAKALAEKGARITFVLPKRLNLSVPFMDIVFASDDPAGKDEMMTGLNAYRSSSKTRLTFPGFDEDIHAYGLILEALKYGKAARRIARSRAFDVIHSHDWLTTPAGIAAKRISGKPWVSHIHATEFDRGSDASVNREVYTIERAGMHKSDRVIAVSEFTKSIITSRYGVSDHKVDVVYNGVSIGAAEKLRKQLTILKLRGQKIVLFVGRITMQKGPDYFLSAAKTVSYFNPNILFFVTGSGDMEHQIIAQAAQLGISDKVIFAGFLRGEELDAVYQAADVFVMPSVSEPFGITALEALAHHVPVIISKQSGVAEILTHALKVDFWDTEEMANKILALVRYQPLAKYMGSSGYLEANDYSWERTAERVMEVYDKL